MTPVKSALLVLLVALPTATMAQRADDLICYSSNLDMAKYVSAEDYRISFNGIALFYLGRLSMIEPVTDWTRLAASRKHLTPEQADLTLRRCVNRYRSLTHAAVTQ
jgi:hypothetical protein